MFEKYFEEGGKWIPRDKLSTGTRMNLAYLEENCGFIFDDRAWNTKSGQTDSFLVFGTAPDGAEAVYEKVGRHAHIWIGGKKHPLRKFEGPMHIYFEVKEMIESIPGMEELGEKGEGEYKDWGRRVDAFYKAKDEAIKKDIESIGVEDLSEEEGKKLRHILDVLYGEYTEEPPSLVGERGKHLFRYLTDEEKADIKRLIKEYRESYGV